MNLNLRNLAPLGFKGGIMTRPTSLSLLWRIRDNRVEYTSGYGSGPCLGIYLLEPAEMRRFKAGKLGITPPGFCNPMGRKTIAKPAYATYQGRVRSKAHLEQLLEDMAP